MLTFHSVFAVFIVNVQILIQNIRARNREMWWQKRWNFYPIFFSREKGQIEEKLIIEDFFSVQQNLIKMLRLREGLFLSWLSLTKQTRNLMTVYFFSSFAIQTSISDCTGKGQIDLVRLLPDNNVQYFLTKPGRGSYRGKKGKGKKREKNVQRRKSVCLSNVFLWNLIKYYGI